MEVILKGFLNDLIYGCNDMITEVPVKYRTVQINNYEVYSTGELKYSTPTSLNWTTLQFHISHTPEGRRYVDESFKEIINKIIEKENKKSLGLYIKRASEYDGKLSEFDGDAILYNDLIMDIGLCKELEKIQGVKH